MKNILLIAFLIGLIYWFMKKKPTESAEKEMPLFDTKIVPSQVMTMASKTSGDNSSSSTGSGSTPSGSRDSEMIVSGNGNYVHQRPADVTQSAFSFSTPSKSCFR